MFENDQPLLAATTTNYISSHILKHGDQPGYQPFLAILSAIIKPLLAIVNHS